MNCFGTTWDWKDNFPHKEIEARINDLLALGANEIGLFQVDEGASDTYLILITDRRDVAQEVVDEVWDAWWTTRYSGEPEDASLRQPEDVPLEWLSNGQPDDS